MKENQIDMIFQGFTTRIRRRSRNALIDKKDLSKYIFYNIVHGILM